MNGKKLPDIVEELINIYNAKFLCTGNATYRIMAEDLIISSLMKGYSASQKEFDTYLAVINSLIMQYNAYKELI